MPTTPKFTKEMLETLEKDVNTRGYKEDTEHLYDTHFPAMRDELKRLWALEEKSNKRIDYLESRVEDLEWNHKEDQP